MDKASLRVIIAYKNFAAWSGISHIGLGVSAINTAKVLVANGVFAEVRPITSADDLLTLMAQDTDRTITHVVVSAPWLPTATYSQLCNTYPRVKFAFNSHSNTAFLQADSKGVQLIREGLDLELGLYNFHVAGNSRRFVSFIAEAYGARCTYLPNLYYVDATTDPNRPLWTQTGGTLRIGVFGATRWQKNIMTAIAGAMIDSRWLKAQTEIHINTARVDGPEVKTIYNAVVNMTANMPNITLVPEPWSSWPAFRKVVGNMHLLMQPSYSESFNMVTADGVAQGVPSVVSDAIQWAPQEWMAEVDDAFAVARAGVTLISDPRAAKQGLLALQAHNADGLAAWMTYLLG